MIQAEKASHVARNRVTIVMAAYNAAHSIAASLESAMTNLGCAIIVIDDGSTDDTANIARALGATVHSQSNTGAAEARKRGLALVQSEYVIILDSDDLLTAATPNLVEFLNSNPEAAVVGGRIGIRTSDGRLRGQGPIPKPQYDTASLLDAPVSPWPPSAAVWRSNSLRQSLDVSVPSLNPRYAEDYELLIRASLVGLVLSVPAVTCHYQTFGGKSSLSAVSALASAEQIRQHYAKALEIDVIHWSPWRIRETAAWRLFRARSVEFGVGRALIWGARFPNEGVLVFAAFVRRLIRRAFASPIS
jgi:glycosyltransferase involved in cell wall biosynthesis